MNKIDIAYNTESADIQFPEYGRSIQEMIQHAKTIDSPLGRQKTVEEIVGLMITLSPTNPNRNIDDFKEKLWNHVFVIANYELDVIPPPGIVIVREEDRPKPEPWAILLHLLASATMAAVFTPSFKRPLKCRRDQSAKVLWKSSLPT
jgi:hypothetical protein